MPECIIEIAVAGFSRNSNFATSNTMRLRLVGWGTSRHPKELKISNKSVKIVGGNALPLNLMASDWWLDVCLGYL